MRRLCLAALCLAAGAACDATPAKPAAVSTTTTTWEAAPVHYIPPVECRTPPSQLKALQAEAAANGYDALQTELERQALKLSQCEAP